MDYRVEAYVQQVLYHVAANERTRRRLAEDLTAHIYEAAGDGDVEQVLQRMGDPRAMAQTLTDSLYEDKAQAAGELEDIAAELNYYRGYEYRSKASLLGIPLVHINVSRSGRPHRMRVARGIIAIGDMAIGLVALGGFAIGGLCVGGISLGLLAFAGIAMGVFALGGVAIGLLAMGGCAIGMYAFGGVAVAARIAVGGVARGYVAVGGDATGAYAISTGGDYLNRAEVTAIQVRDLIQTALPQTGEWLIRFFTLPFR